MIFCHNPQLLISPGRHLGIRLVWAFDSFNRQRMREALSIKLQRPYGSQNDFAKDWKMYLNLSAILGDGEVMDDDYLRKAYLDKIGGDIDSEEVKEKERATVEYLRKMRGEENDIVKAMKTKNKPFTRKGRIKRIGIKRRRDG